METFVWYGSKPWRDKLFAAAEARLVPDRDEVRRRCWLRRLLWNLRAQLERQNGSH